jgi:hypothetical protein
LIFVTGIYGAIDYAANLGFQPQSDFKFSQYLLEKKSSLVGDYRIEYGKNGQPFYIAGPEDNVKLIMRKLEEKLNRDHFDFIVGEGR